MEDYDLDYPCDYPCDDLETLTVEADEPCPAFQDPVTGQDYDGLDYDDFYPGYDD